MGESRCLTVYTATGQTFRFESVSEVEDSRIGDEELRFRYVSSSRPGPFYVSSSRPGQACRAVFSLGPEGVVGYTVDEGVEVKVIVIGDDDA
jgi:hypothetical protein